MAIETQTLNVAKAGKYLSFRIADEEYGVEILKVQEINGITEITRVPRTPDFVRGVINLRGRVIPVIDLRAKFGMESIADTEKTCNIVVKLNHRGAQITMGMIVDDVSEVLNITEDEIAPPPELAGYVEDEFITGIGKLDQRVVILLDIDRIMKGEDLKHLGGDEE